MKVRELIALLQQQDPEADAYIVWSSPDGDEFECIVDVQKDQDTVDILGSSTAILKEF